MKRTCTMLAMLVILMASFMSICNADEACATEMAVQSMHDCANAAAETKAPTKEAKKSVCEAACHVSMVSLPQFAKITTNHLGTEDRALSTLAAIPAGHVTVLYQPPQHA